MFVTTLRSAFPDVHYTVETVFAEGEMAAGSITARYTPRRVLWHRSYRQRGNVDRDPCRAL